MNAIIITHAGAVAPGFNSLRHNEYNITVVPRIIDTNSVSDSDLEAASFCQENVDPATELLERMTIVKLLEDDSLAGAHVVLCSNDVSPRIHAKLLEKRIDEMLEKHQDADVISLVADDSIEHKAEDFVTPDTEIVFSNNTSTPTSTAYAIVIPSSKRHKLAGIVSKAALCIPDAIRYGSLTGKLHVYYPNTNMFWRNQTVQRAEKRPLSVIMTSYKRPKELLRQILSMFNQTYTDFKMYVAVKGMTEPEFRTLILAHVFKFIKDGRLSIQYFPNKNQLSNLLDCVRFSDLKRDSLCVKVDDDDIYHPRFLEHLMAFHSSLPADVGSYYNGFSWELAQRGTYKGMRSYKSDWIYGNSVVFPADIFADLKSIEKNPQNANERYSPRAGFREDNILIDLCKDNGAVDRTKFFEMAGWCSDVIVDRSDNSSVTRTSEAWYITEEFRSANNYIGSDPDSHEYTIALKTKAHGNTAAVIFGREILMLDPLIRGIVVFHEPGIELGVRWDNGFEDEYKRTDTGVFKSVDLA